MAGKNNIGRRQFLKVAGTAVGAIGFGFPPVLARPSRDRQSGVLPYIVPASALGKAGNVAASNRIVMGCIGMGGQGTGNMRGFLGKSEVQVVAVCDVVKSRRQEAKNIVDRHYGDKGCAGYNDFRDVLARKDIDAVMIAPQDHWHALIAVAAARAGKDIYCEKPLGVAVREGQAIRDAVRRYGRVFQTGTQQRSDRKFRFACELARNGYLGDIHTVKVATPGPNYKRTYSKPPTAEPIPAGLDYNMYIGPAPMKPYNAGRHAWPDWYLIWDYCAGFIVNWGVHHLDIANWGCPAVTGEPFELECKASYRSDGLTDNINDWQAEFSYASGLHMTYTDSDNPNKQGCQFEGNAGWVHVNRAGMSVEPESLLQVKIKPDEIHLYESREHRADFLNCVRTRSDPVAPVEAGHKASYLGMIADIAARANRKIKWDPVAERFVNDDEANPDESGLTRPMRSPWHL